MKKIDVRKRVLKDGKPLALKLFSWDEDTRTFSSTISGLVIDFSDCDNCAITAWNNSTITAGDNGTITTGDNCAITAGSGCTITTWNNSTITAGSGCTITAGDNGTITARNYGRIAAWNNCAITALRGCTITARSGCTITTQDNYTITIRDNCTFIVNGYLFPTPPLHFSGSRYYMEVSGPDTIRSGCIDKPLAWWQENVRRCAAENNYTPEQVDEYELYVSLLAIWMDKYGSQIVKAAGGAE